MILTPPDSEAAQAAAEVVARLQQSGHEALWAGGCVRDLLLGRTPKDYDIATDAPAQRTLDLFPGSIEVGKAFGVVRVPRGNEWIEVATFREDAAYSDGRHPDTVTFSDARHDAQRRDFTVNALFYDPARRDLVDHVGGLKDLDARVIRCVGNPADRFREDHLRLLRAVRFAGTLGFAIHPETESAVRDCAHLITRTSPERVRDELERLLCESPEAGDALRLLDRTGLLAQLIPEITAMKGQAQPPEFHPEGDVFEHTVLMLNAMEGPTPTLAWSVLLHDVGKPATAFLDGTRWRFNNHATVGADMAVRILRRLRASSRLTEEVAACVAGHMRFTDVGRMKRSTLRRLVGRSTFDTELELHRLDCTASHGGLDHYHLLQKSRQAFEDEPVLPDAYVTGRDIIALGVVEGPDVGRFKRVAYDAQLEGTVTSREQALAWIQDVIEKETAG